MSTGARTALSADHAAAGATTIESLVRRDQRAIIAGLTLVTLACWAWLLPMSVDMYGAMDGPSAWMMLQTWDLRYFLLMFAMWVVMMAGMMLPSAAPAILLYGTVARKLARSMSPAAGVSAFTAGYLVAWTVFSAVATLAQWALDRLALLSPMMVSSSPMLGAFILIAAGIWQWTPLKDACLVSCRSPLHFLSSRWKDSVAGALRLGVAHGTHCIGCCWALMLLLFFGGVMNPWCIGAIAVFVLLEKVMPGGASVGRAGGAMLVAAGCWVLLDLPG